MSGKKSRDKGARGEREAAKYLTSLGFPVSRMGRNGYSDEDLRHDSLPNIHFEVKYGYSLDAMDIHTKSLRDAWWQAAVATGDVDEDAPGGPAWVHLDGVDTEPVVLWKPPRKPWRLTWMEPCGLVTTTGDDAIKAALLRLDGGG